MQGKSEWEKQKEEEAKEEAERKREEKDKKKKQKKRKMMEVKKVVEEWKIWDEEEEVEAKKLVLEQFHKWIKVFGKKQSERMPIRKVWNHAIDVKEGFSLRKGKMYPLSREEREEVRKFIEEQLRKGYI